MEKVNAGGGQLPQQMTQDEFRSALAGAKPKRHKYAAQRTEHNGRKFASKKEASRAAELETLLAAGAISDLRYQVRYAITIPTTYVADFTYRLPNGEVIVEDVKGYRTREYKRKRKAMLEQHGIEIEET